MQAGWKRNSSRKNSQAVLLDSYLQHLAVKGFTENTEYSLRSNGDVSGMMQDKSNHYANARIVSPRFVRLLAVPHASGKRARNALAGPPVRQPDFF
jgi:hypothetical protein